MVLQNWWYKKLAEQGYTQLPALQKSIEADVLIVGVGVAGVAAAAFFMGKGLKVVVLEKTIFGGSSSGKSAGFLTPDSELELWQLVQKFGKNGAADLWGAATRGIDLITGYIRTYKISCELMPQNSLFLGNGKSGFKNVMEEKKAHEQMNFPHTFYTAAELSKVIGSHTYTAGLRSDNVYVMNALFYCQGMKKILAGQGIDIYEGSEVIFIKDHTAYTSSGSVKAGKIIFTADKLLPAINSFAAKSVYHAQTFLCISEPLTMLQQGLLFPEKHFQCWDTDLVYNYFRLTEDHRILLGGGDAYTTFSPHDVQSPKVIQQVVEKFKEKFPFLEDLHFPFFWPGKIDTREDMIPTVYRDAQNPDIHFVLGCVGLPWASFCGDFAARHTYNDAGYDDQKYYTYFQQDRNVLLPPWTQYILGKQLRFSINSMRSKYGGK